MAAAPPRCSWAEGEEEGMDGPSTVVLLRRGAVLCCAVLCCAVWWLTNGRECAARTKDDCGRGFATSGPGGVEGERGRALRWVGIRQSLGLPVSQTRPKRKKKKKKKKKKTKKRDKSVLGKERRVKKGR